MASKTTLLSAASNGTGPAATHNGRGTVIVTGTFDSATVTVEVSIDGTTWVTFKTFGAAATETVDFATDFVRGKVAGGLGSELIDMQINKVLVS